jgi:hypothetical protein
MPRTPTTRSHGEGSIYRSDDTRRGTGVTVERWIASVDVGVGPNDVRLRKKITGPTRKAVAAKLREIRREHAPATARRAAHRPRRPDRRSPARSTHRRPGRGVAPPGGVVRRQGWQAAGAGELPGLQADVGRDVGVGDRAPSAIRPRAPRRGAPSLDRRAGTRRGRCAALPRPRIDPPTGLAARRGAWRRWCRSFHPP